jgi:ATP cone domain
MCRRWYYFLVSITVTKADGSTEYFKVEKLRRSLRRAGATPTELSTIIAAIEKRLYDGITTQAIYRMAFEQLRHTEQKAATRYSLRRALFGLGPTGFPFERYLGRVFEAEGYTTKTGILVPGHCAEHEIDVAAYKTEHSFVAEAKFHARPGIKTDLQVAMYSYARLLDLRDATICTDDICGIKEFWLITNTKFTSAAEKYANCVGLTILSWDYPRKNNLHDRIQRLGVYPITVLSSLSPSQVATLLQNDCILCSDIVAKPHILRHLHTTPSKVEAILNEATGIGAGGVVNR